MGGTLVIISRWVTPGHRAWPLRACFTIPVSILLVVNNKNPAQINLTSLWNEEIQSAIVSGMAVSRNSNVTWVICFRVWGGKREKQELWLHSPLHRARSKMLAHIPITQNNHTWCFSIFASSLFHAHFILLIHANSEPAKYCILPGAIKNWIFSTASSQEVTTARICYLRSLQVDVQECMFVMPALAL